MNQFPILICIKQENNIHANFIAIQQLSLWHRHKNFSENTIRSNKRYTYVKPTRPGEAYMRQQIKSALF